MKLYHKTAFLIIGYLLIGGCKKFVQVAAPETQLVTASVFNNGSSATSAMINVYSKMMANNDSYYLAFCNGLLADELTSYSQSTLVIPFYQNSLSSVSNGLYRWNVAYNYIYQANVIIDGLQAYGNGINAAIVNQLSGEARFIRAFWLFYLTNMYGNIPLTTSSNYTTNQSLGRTSQDQIYQQIIADLSKAQNLLNSNYVDASDTTTTSERTRPTKSAADALLARVYLYTGKYDSAEIVASSILNNTAMYGLCQNLDSVFLANSVEAIWQLQVPLPNSNVATAEGRYFVLISAPTTGVTNSTTISPQLLNAFEAGDNRRVHWIGGYPATNPRYYFPYKYKVYKSNATSTPEYVMVFRLAEQYLIRAEARAQQGDLSGAVSDLNIIRTRANLTPYSGATDQISIFQAILHERQVELFTEWGHRWFDLIRSGNLNSVMGSPGNVCQMKQGVWNTDWKLYPIPVSDLNLDPNLTQNDGY